MNEFNNEEIRVLESKDKLRRLQTRLGGRLRLVGSQKLVKFQHHIREGALTKVHGKGRRCAPCHLALLTEELVYSRPKDNKCAPSCHDIAAIWVAFFSRWQRYRRRHSHPPFLRRSPSKTLPCPPLLSDTWLAAGRMAR